jgi:hypothetical protein
MMVVCQIEVLHHNDKMKGLTTLASKYEVYETHAGGQTTSGSPCLRACEQRVFEKVSVKTLRRSFCDLTSNLTSQSSSNEDEFNYHLVERPVISMHN